MRSTRKGFDRNSALQAACGTSSARVTGCNFALLLSETYTQIRIHKSGSSSPSPLRYALQNKTTGKQPNCKRSTAHSPQPKLNPTALRVTAVVAESKNQESLSLWAAVYGVPHLGQYSNIAIVPRIDYGRSSSPGSFVEPGIPKNTLQL